jgi:hypothetical protein
MSKTLLLASQRLQAAGYYHAGRGRFFLGEKIFLMGKFLNVLLKMNSFSFRKTRLTASSYLLMAMGRIK